MTNSWCPIAKTTKSRTKHKPVRAFQADRGREVPTCLPTYAENNHNHHTHPQKKAYSERAVQPRPILTRFRWKPTCRRQRSAVRLARLQKTHEYRWTMRQGQEHGRRSANTEVKSQIMVREQNLGNYSGSAQNDQQTKRQHSRLQHNQSTEQIAEFRRQTSEAGLGGLRARQCNWLRRGPGLQAERGLRPTRRCRLLRKEGEPIFERTR